MFCILKNSFKVVLSNESPKRMEVEELGVGVWKAIFVLMLQS